MTTVLEQNTTIQALFDHQVESLARTSGFIKRRRKWSGTAFIKTLISAWMHNPDASLSELQQSAIANGCDISIKTLATRLAQPQTTAFVQALLEQVLRQGWASEVPSASIIPVAQVILLDTTQVTLPAIYQDEWPGGGNQNAKRAGMKIQAAYDWYQGHLSLTFHPAITNDGNLPIPELAAGSLVVQDAGFFGVKRCQSYQDRHLHWLSRFPSNRKLTTVAGVELSLGAFLQTFTDREWIDEWVAITTQQFPVRLIAQRLPPEVAHNRQQRLIAETKRRSATRPTPEALNLCHWFFLATDLPADVLSAQQAVVLYRARWQIELLFKFWKHYAGIQRWRSANPQRILTEIYAKLLIVLLQQRLLATVIPKHIDRSLFKVARVFQQQAARFVDALHSPHQLQLLCSQLTHHFRVCRVAKRRQRPAFFQLLEHFFT